MNEKEYKVVTLADNTRWFVIAQTNYKDGTYQFGIGINQDNDITDEVRVMRVYQKDNHKYFLTVNDPEILKQVTPLLIPEAKEYIDNPEKIKELINQN